MKVFIVESPTKARTIQRFLGSDFKVVATLGHIKDLPEDELGIDEETLRAKYVYVKGKKKIVQKLKELARRASAVYIGTDPDREGEAIAYFVKEELKKVQRNIKRAVFYEITPEAIYESIRNAGDINMNMVYSQFARRILDRLIGYKISPVLWKEFNNYRLSAGRVQSPALRLIVEREKEIEEFRSKKYYYVKAIFEKEGKKFEAVYDYSYEKAQHAKIILEKLKGAIFTVVEVRKRIEKIAPPRPFITSTLQSEANSRLGFSPEKTQAIAQKLYEEGFITYPRTDSYRMNEEKAREFLRFIEQNYGKEYVGRIRKFRDRPTSQSAHECIRVVNPDSFPEGNEEKKLYELILRRTLASLMSDARIERTTVIIEATGPKIKTPIYLVAKGVSVVFEGWMKVYPSDMEIKELPELFEGEILKPQKLFIEERKTQPPPRYTEGSLVKTLEKLGIGRPSTYATIVKNLKDRNYVFLEKKSLRPTEIAFKVVDFLKEKFPELMDYKFTAKLEKELDLVEEGRKDWKEVVREMSFVWKKDTRRTVSDVNRSIQR